MVKISITRSPNVNAHVALAIQTQQVEAAVRAAHPGEVVRVVRDVSDAHRGELKAYVLVGDEKSPLERTDD